MNVTSDLSISGLDSVYCLNNAPASVQVLPAGGTLAGARISNNSFSPAAAGVGTHTISYSYTDSTGCAQAISLQVEVNLCDGILALYKKELKVYPNPTSDLVNIEFAQGINALSSLGLYNVQGKKITAKVLASGGDSIQLDMSALEKGFYFIKLKAGNKIFTGKIILN